MTCEVCDVEEERRESAGRFTVESLPPDHQASEAQKEEDAPDDSLPLCSGLLHLWVGLTERQPVH